MSKERAMTLGSLFDGIGGFPLAGKMAGITPIWASEIEPFPIRVTEKRLPEMRHHGDVHALDGGKLEPVDIVTFGSPCQGLSVAGLKKGMQDERSALFFEAVRVIREMRCATNEQYPRWVVWENVPGALSSARGEDFRQVLESLVRIKNPEADVPLPQDGKWMSAGEIMGDGYSLAWRILDAAKGWGVAQRRRRVFLVLDLAGECAGEVLFESEGVSGYTPPSGKAWEETPTYPAAGVGEAGKRNLTGKDVPVVYGISSDQSNGMLSDNPHAGIYEADTSRTLDISGGNPSCNQGGMLIVEPRPAYGLDRAAYSQGENAQYKICVNEEVSPTITANGPGLVAGPATDYVVRRLTPGECCRLQGFPDGWSENLASQNPSDEEIVRWEAIFEEWRKATDDKKKPKTRKQIMKWLMNPDSDAAQYKAYGNSVAVPCVFFVLAGIVWAERGDELENH